MKPLVAKISCLCLLCGVHNPKTSPNGLALGPCPFGDRTSIIVSESQGVSYLR
jgi:hypothetical protein